MTAGHQLSPLLLVASTESCSESGPMVMSTGRPFCRQHKTNPVWSAGTFAVVAGSPRQLADLLSKRSAGI